jgi:hypothetical protein
MTTNHKLRNTIVGLNREIKTQFQKISKRNLTFKRERIGTTKRVNWGSKERKRRETSSIGL